MSLSSVKSLPNLLTSIRLVLCPIIAYFVLHSEFVIALVLFIFACLTDYFDGYLARKLNSVTALGRLLDPIADKVITFTFFTILMSKGICPPWFLGLVITVNLLQSLGYCILYWSQEHRKTIYEPLKISKVNAALQFFWIGVLILDLLLQAASPANLPIGSWVRLLSYVSLSMLQITVFFTYFFHYRQHLALDSRSLTATH